MSDLPLEFDLSKVFDTIGSLLLQSAQLGRNLGWSWITDGRDQYLSIAELFTLSDQFVSNTWASGVPLQSMGTMLTDQAKLCYIAGLCYQIGWQHGHRNLDSDPFVTESPNREEDDPGDTAECGR